MRRPLTALLAAACLAVTSLGTAALAQDKYPSKPVKIIVPYAPGGATDITARLVAQGLSERLGQQVVIENRAGAGNNIGTEIAINAPPDGYTLFFGNVGTVSINPTLYPDMTVKPDKAFVAVSVASETPSVYIANPKFPPNTVKELIDYAKARPGKVNFASPGSGSVDPAIGAVKTVLAFVGIGLAALLAVGVGLILMLPAPSGSVIAKAERSSPRTTGIAHHSFCAAVPTLFRSIMLPSSGAAELKTTGPKMERFISS